MQCARLELQERSKPKVRRQLPSGKPRRICQKRMINPDQCDDYRWNAVLERFTCNPTINFEDYHYVSNGASARPEEDLCLTIQNLKFQGDVQERKRPRTSFKYKSLSGNRKHRMFVKQVVDEISSCDEDRSSDMTSYYFDDYVKYILSTDRSRPSSSKSSIFLQDLSNKYRETKPILVEKQTNPKKTNRIDKAAANKAVKLIQVSENNPSENNNNIVDGKVAYHKTRQRKSLTISRIPSPETIQVIRVDVVCNYSTSSMISDYDDNKSQIKDITKLTDQEIEKLKIKSPHFADKYLLTNTVKSIDENLSCGSKVTLLCKTFKLTDRTPKTGKKYSKSAKEGGKSKVVL